MRKAPLSKPQAGCPDVGSPAKAGVQSFRRRRWAPAFAGEQGASQRPTESFSTLPALNLGWVDSLICIGSPVRGLRPVEALRFEQEKVPKPTRRTSSPRFKALVIASNTPSTARLASLLPSPVVSATVAISSCLLMSLEPLFPIDSWRKPAAI